LRCYSSAWRQPGPTKDDPTRLLRVVEELRAWVRREFAFVRAYPALAIPSHWTRRPLSPHELRRRRRMWRNSVGEAVGERA
jgi:hypothetical protein